MFKIIPNPTFEGMVSITVPGEDKPAALRVTWRHKGRKALAVWLRKGAPQPELQTTAATKPLDAKPLDDAAWLAEVLDGWHGPVDPQDEAVPFSTAALAELLDACPAAGAELLAAYLAAMTESRAKN